MRLPFRGRSKAGGSLGSRPANGLRPDLRGRPGLPACPAGGRRERKGRKAPRLSHSLAGEEGRKEGRKELRLASPRSKEKEKEKEKPKPEMLPLLLASLLAGLLGLLASSALPIACAEPPPATPCPEGQSWSLDLDKCMDCSVCRLQNKNDFCSSCKDPQPQDKFWIVVGAISGAVIMVCLVAGVVIYVRCRRREKFTNLSLDISNEERRNRTFYYLRLFLKMPGRPLLLPWPYTLLHAQT
ncbi:hypothetical protein JD844_001334 [Phrynosoma platyrhinos]|uniref:Tumor necrosis factor receptor superfamily member 12A n=1 Tax=Phrynosoma platyrhinos TaxID=52577 RepID=A0ABQ7TA96_PHRPL|nr:hypothetical protein JD844_001334 [Phrynosoma platyrhinos]